jgi:hypothetical protein
MRIHRTAAFAALCLSCNGVDARGCAQLAPGASTEPRATDAPVATAPPGTSSPAVPGAAAAGATVVGAAGIAAFDAMAAAEKARLKATPSLYLHQSVGQDLEDGAEEIGWKFEYYGPNESRIGEGLHGGLFNDVGPIDNGKPLEKLALVRSLAQRHAGSLRVLAFSFGYADVRDADLARVEAEYVDVARAVAKTGARMLHVTPPLVFDPSENAAKMKMRTWMLATFAKDTVFDLQDIESQDGGKRCEVGGVWRICPANRSTAACPSKGQGVDGDGQGHLCSKKGALFARALLYAIARAGA